MRLDPLPPTTIFDGRASVYQTFHGTPTFYRLHGPVSLVRLVQFAKVTREGVALDASRTEGEFWFEQEVFSQLRRHAEADLRRQAARDRKTYSTDLSRLVAVYMMHTLRSDLAISKDWTTDFDAYVTLHLGASDSVTTLVGRVKAQPYYSKSSPMHAATRDLELLGLKRQYVINFRSPDNKPLVSRIVGPTLF